MARIVLILIVYVSAVWNVNAFSLEAANPSFMGGFKIRQEIAQNGHVLVSGPAASDREIVRIIAENNIRSLREYSVWLKEHVEYRQDGRQDKWLSSQETLKRKYGDCEDYAFLNAAVLKVLGYRPRVLAVGDREKSHAICVFEKDGKYMWFDNAELNDTDAFSLREFAEYIFSNFKGSLISEMDLSGKTHTILYARTA